MIPKCSFCLRLKKNVTILYCSTDQFICIYFYFIWQQGADELEDLNESGQLRAMFAQFPVRYKTFKFSVLLLKIKSSLDVSDMFEHLNTNC